MRKLTPAETKAAFVKELEANLQPWLKQLSRDGLDTSVPMENFFDEKAKITSGFGPRDSSKIITKSGTASGMHRGVDFRTVKSPDGRDVFIKSIIAGTVLAIGDPGDGSGECDFIGGVDGRVYAVAHSKRNSHKMHVGQTVSRDDALAIMGQTGTASADCAHVTMYELPFVAKGFSKPNFKDWSWQNRTGFFNDHVSPEAFKKELHAALARDSNHRINWSDMHREVAVTGYPDPEKTPQKQMAEGGVRPANDERDRYPHVYALETYLKKHAPTPELSAFMEKWDLHLVNKGTAEKPRMRIEELHPTSTQPSPLLKQLDQAVYAFSKDHEAPRHPSPVKIAPAKAGAAPEKSAWEKAMEVACDWTGFGCAAEASTTTPKPTPGMSRSTAAPSISAPIHDRTR